MKGHARDARFVLDDVELTSITSVSLAVDGGVNDVTAQADDSRHYNRGPVDARVTVEGVYDDDECPAISELGRGTALVPWSYFPLGSVSGRTYFAGTGLVNTHDVPAAMDAAVTYSFTVQNSGPIAPGTVA